MVETVERKIISEEAEVEYAKSEKLRFRLKVEQWLSLTSKSLLKT
jgi:hypothetical protein